MNKVIKTMALLAVLSVAAVSCQKENTPLSVADDVVTDHQAVYIYQIPSSTVLMENSRG